MRGTRSHFQHDRLPLPRPYWERELGKLRRPDRKGWSRGRCPFHKGTSGTSFSVNLDSGGFYCHGCNAKGGDLIDYVRLRDGCDFKTACQRLGCWDETGKPVRKVPTRKMPFLVMDFTIEGVQYREEVEDEPKTELELHRRLYAEAKDRLAELRQGDIERFDGEEDLQWGTLASSWELIQIEQLHE